MKLVAFRIKNFRSIVDSGWCDLSPDNISGFIGQNESGKTSVLEALNSFYDEELDADFLRSDGSRPEISCSFNLSDDEFETLFSELNLPSAVKTKFKAVKNRINLKCSWPADKYAIELEQEEIATLFVEEVTPAPVPAPAAAETPAVAAAATTTPVAVAEATEPEQQPAKLTTAKEFIDRFVEGMPEFVYFEDFQSLIPNEMDIAEITKEGSKAEGIYGVQNFLTVIGIEPDELIGKDARIVQSLIDRCNKGVTADFREFWSQHIGLNNKIEIEMELKYHNATDDAAKAGQPYLAFWVKDGEERLYPKQRSKGVRWFLSFYLQLKASKASSVTGQVLLIDEPGASLHARAQEDVLSVFENIKDTLQILYTTHSPYLIKPETLYRLLAVQRDDAADEKSATKIIGIHNIGQASTDTMFPVYTIIGADLSHQQVVKSKDNVLLEEPSAFYYLSAFHKLVNETHAMYFMPATGVTKLPTLSNLFRGWGLKFGVVVDDDKSGREVYNDLKRNWYGDDEVEAKKHVYKIKDCTGIEDIFSVNDFKKHVLEESGASITSTNSDYLKQQSGKSGAGVSKVVLAYNFYQKVESGKVKLTDLTQATQTKIKDTMEAVRTLL